MTATITVMPKEIPMNIPMRRIQVNVVDLLSQETEYMFRREYHPNILDKEGHMIWVDNEDGKINKHTGKVEQEILTDKTKVSIGTYDGHFKELLESRIRQLLMQKFNPLQKSIKGFTIEIAVSALVADESMYKEGITEIVTYDRDARYNEPQHKTLFTK